MALSSRSLRRSQSLHEQTYQALRTAILSGEFAAGERLVETQLAERLQVSRTPIREAMRQLQRENLITAEVGGGLRVSVLSVEDAAQLYDCRIALEKLSVAEACLHATEAELKRLKQVVERAESLSSQPTRRFTNFELLHIDQQFHRSLAQSSANPWLVALLDQTFDKMALLRVRTLQQNPEVLEVRSEHRRIYDAVYDRQVEAAVTAMNDHLLASKARVIQEIQQSQSDSQSLEASSK